jgi:monoamine oxidase
MQTKPPSAVDVTIIGAGISGLFAARAIKAAAPQLRIAVLEASDRAGGRIFTDDAGTELGAAFFGPGQQRMLKLIAELGLATYEVDGAGLTVLEVRDNSRYTFNDLLPEFNWFVKLDVNAAWRQIDVDAQSIPTDKPHEAARADELDRTNLDEYLRRLCWTNSGFEYLRLQMSTVMANESKDISALAALWFIHTVGDLGTMLVGESWKCKGGNSQIIRGLVSSIGEEKVFLECAVRSIDTSDNESIVVTGDGYALKTTRVIFATPPGQIFRVSFTPSLPAPRVQELQRYPMSRVIKTFMYYPSRIWKKKGFSGRALSSSPMGCANDIFDDSSTEKPEGCILGFVNGDAAGSAAQKSVEERKRALACHYARLFDDKTLEHPSAYKEKMWSEEPWIGGCYFGCPTQGTLSVYRRQWRTNLGNRIFFCGTEAANQWMGYMEGGVESAERAVADVLNSLNLSTTTRNVIDAGARVDFTSAALPTIGYFGLMAVALSAVIKTILS